MKYTLIIDESREEEIIIYAKNKTKIIEEIESIIDKVNNKIFGYSNDEIININKNDVIVFFIEDGKTYAYVDKDKYLVKYRIYELESILSNDFIKINQSCIANINKIKKFKPCFNGSLEIIFINGYSDFISRRELKKVKERLGL